MFQAVGGWPMPGTTVEISLAHASSAELRPKSDFRRIKCALCG